MAYVKQKAQPKKKVPKSVAVVFCLITLAVAVYEVTSYFHNGIVADANSPMFVCSQTGKSFRHALTIGESIPVYSPYSGSNTGYPAEACFWTADGQIKKDPTWVLLNESIGKRGPTFCPDCGRLVVGHNPVPNSSATPPPTKQEYLARHPEAAAELLHNQ